jgi:uncharacterized protein
MKGFTMRITHFAVTAGLAAMLAVPALALADSDSPQGRASDPSIAQIYQAAENGNSADADRMIAKVLQDHPESAKAHYVHAELLSKEGKLASARTEFDRANALAPGLPFAKPEAVAELRERIEGSAAPRRIDAPVGRPVSAAPSSEPAAASGFGFSPMKLGLGVLLIAALFFVFRRFNGGPRPNGGPVVGPHGPYGQPGMPSYGAGPTGYAPYAGAPGAAPAGSGLGGALMTGAAAGLGAVAVEEAVRHFAGRDEPRVVEYGDRGRDNAGGWGDNLGPNPNSDMGGNDFGISDPGSWDSGGGGGVDPGSDWN